MLSTISRGFVARALPSPCGAGRAFSLLASFYTSAAHGLLSAKESSTNTRTAAARRKRKIKRPTARRRPGTRISSGAARVVAGEASANKVDSVEPEPKNVRRGPALCYLLRAAASTSALPTRRQRSGMWYIGYTGDGNAERRLRQHNGDLVGGAKRTRMGRPWELVLTVEGFSTHAMAMQFEWAWQRPRLSVHTKHALKEQDVVLRRGWKGKLRALPVLLNASSAPWASTPDTTHTAAAGTAPDVQCTDLRVEGTPDPAAAENNTSTLPATIGPTPQTTAPRVELSVRLFVKKSEILEVTSLLQSYIASG